VHSNENYRCRSSWRSATASSSEIAIERDVPKKGKKKGKTGGVASRTRAFVSRAMVFCDASS
jgi:hypothetical protein